MGLMDSERLTVKLYVARTQPVDAPPPTAAPPAIAPPAVAPRELVRIFHAWIQDDRLPHHLPIDVADYSHVHRGPGIVLACHAGFFAFDAADGRPGLRYRRRRPAYDQAPLPDALRSLASACKLLQEEPGVDLPFETSELLLQVDDRLRTARPEAALDALRGELAALPEAVFGRGARLRLEAAGSAGEPFAARLRISGGTATAGWKTPCAPRPAAAVKPPADPPG